MVSAVGNRCRDDSCLYQNIAIRASVWFLFTAFNPRISIDSCTGLECKRTDIHELLVHCTDFFVQ
jgi:hypothetical protein